MRYAVLFGPPNSGKSTLFNQLTGKSSNVVNYPGSTVDISFSNLKNHSSVTLIDVPGVQSFLPRSEDEKLSLKAISKLDELVSGAHSIPDLVICVIDATQSSRHLAMTKRLIDDGYPVIVVITMSDEAKEKGIVIDHVRLSQKLGVSVFMGNGRNEKAQSLIEDGIVCNGVRYEGSRFDCGEKSGFVKANIALALQDDDINSEILEFLKTLSDAE